MGSRLQLHDILKGILGSSNVYFQPPANITMNYPAIVYSREDMVTEFADNKPYTVENRYEVTYISTNPDSGVPREIAHLPKCVFSRHFTADNLHHDIFTIHF